MAVETIETGTSFKEIVERGGEILEGGTHADYTEMLRQIPDSETKNLLIKEAAGKGIQIGLEPGTLRPHHQRQPGPSGPRIGKPTIGVDISYPTAEEAQELTEEAQELTTEVKTDFSFPSQAVGGEEIIGTPSPRPTGSNVIPPAPVSTTDPMYNAMLAALTKQMATGSLPGPSDIVTPAGDPGKLSRLMTLFKDPGFQRLVGTGIIAAVAGPNRGRAAKTFGEAMDVVSARDLERKKLEAEERRLDADAQYKQRMAQVASLGELRAGAEFSAERLKYRTETLNKIRENMYLRGPLPEEVRRVAIASDLGEDIADMLYEDQKNNVSNLEKYKPMKNSKGEITGYIPSAEHTQLMINNKNLDQLERNLKANEFASINNRAKGVVQKILLNAQQTGPDGEPRGIDPGALNFWNLRHEIYDGVQYSSDGLDKTLIYSPADYASLLTDLTIGMEDRYLKNELTKATIEARRSSANWYNFKRIDEQNKNNPAYPLKDLSQSSRNTIVSATLNLEKITQIEQTVRKLMVEHNREVTDPSSKYYGQKFFKSPEELLEEYVGKRGWLRAKAEEWMSILKASATLGVAFQELQSATLNYISPIVAELQGASVSSEEIKRAMNMMANINDMPKLFLTKLYNSQAALVQTFRLHTWAGGVDPDTAWREMRKIVIKPRPGELTSVDLRTLPKSLSDITAELAPDNYKRPVFGTTYQKRIPVEGGQTRIETITYNPDTAVTGPDYKAQNDDLVIKHFQNTIGYDINELMTTDIEDIDKRQGQ